MLKQVFLLTLAAATLTGCTGSSPEPASQPNPVSDRIPISDTAVDGDVIRLTSPQEGQVLKSPFLVGGEASVAGDIVYVRVKNPAGDVVISEQARAQVPGGPFGVLISFVFQSTDRGIVEVYGIDPESGAETALESVSVNFDTSFSGSAQTSP